MIKRIPVDSPKEPSEREPVINYDNSSGSATVYTWDQKINTYMTKNGVTADKVFTVNGRQAAWTYTVPKTWVKVRRPKRMPPKNKDIDTTGENVE